MELRLRVLKEVTSNPGPIIYWMNRDQRVDDNWALLDAQTKATELKQPLIVVFCISKEHTSSINTKTDRNFLFMKQGLLVVRERLNKLNMPFIIRNGEADVELPKIIKEIKASHLFVDFNPLRDAQAMIGSVKAKINISMFEVDAHNVIPAFYVTNKQEWGAYTLRPKVHKLLDKYLTDFPALLKQAKTNLNIESDDKSLLGEETKVIDYASLALKEFVEKRLKNYDQRNDPNADATSRLSAYLHFGQLSAQRIALATKQSKLASDSFLEELIVRKELADNYVLYNPNYDNFEGLPDWAKKTLNKHLDDPREYVYTLKQFEDGKTHDPIWNAAQLQMVKSGYMHGYVRMYWAKKILEWSKDPQAAIKTAIYLNDKYELDGQDPNGYVGVMWAIGGVHDRPWQERKIFGMVRFMNDKGMKRKFDVGAYTKKWL
jgi:deoxyribodipyrimidine photo-lyase